MPQASVVNPYLELEDDDDLDSTLKLTSTLQNPSASPKTAGPPASMRVRLWWAEIDRKLLSSRSFPIISIRLVLSVSFPILHACLHIKFPLQFSEIFNLVPCCLGNESLLNFTALEKFQYFIRGTVHVPVEKVLESSGGSASKVIVI